MSLKNAIKGTGDFEVKEWSIYPSQAVINGTFEEDISGVDNFRKGDGDATLSHYTEDAITGNGSLRLKQTTSSENAVRPSFSITCHTDSIKVNHRYKIKFKTKVLSGSPKISSVNGVILGGAASNGNESLLKDYVFSGEESFEFEHTIVGRDNDKMLFYFSGNDEGHTDFDLLIDDVSIIELPPLPGFKNGTKYLENTADGTVAWESKKAYGTWEFDVFKDSKYDRLNYYFILDTHDTSGQGYNFVLFTENEIYFQRWNGGGHTIFHTDKDYISNNTWYRIKITRTMNNEFTVYIKGGEFGNEYQLVDTSGGDGDNPIQNNNYTMSNYSVVDFDNGSKITNIKIKEGVEK